MDSPEWVPPSNLWLIHTEGFSVYVDEVTAQRVKAALKSTGGQVGILTITDIAGSEVTVPLSRVEGVILSDPDIRARDRAINRMLAKEREEDEPSWLPA